MRRIIQFRVRDERTKTILGYEMFNTALNDGYCFYMADDPEEILHSNYSTPPMIKPLRELGQLLREEFTGLKDKNGKEIYEGDIIKHPICEQGVIEWFAPYCGFQVVKGDFLYDLNDDTTGIEVIGNIHQNPELI